MQFARKSFLQKMLEDYPFPEKTLSTFDFWIPLAYGTII